MEMPAGLSFSVPQDPVQVAFLLQSARPGGGRPLGGAPVAESSGQIAFSPSGALNPQLPPRKLGHIRFKSEASLLIYTPIYLNDDDEGESGSEESPVNKECDASGSVGPIRKSSGQMLDTPVSSATGINMPGVAMPRQPPPVVRLGVRSSGGILEGDAMAAASASVRKDVERVIEATEMSSPPGGDPPETPTTSSSTLRVADQGIRVIGKQDVGDILVGSSRGANIETLPWEGSARPSIAPSRRSDQPLDLGPPPSNAPASLDFHAAEPAPVVCRPAGGSGLLALIPPPYSSPSRPQLPGIPPCARIIEAVPTDYDRGGLILRSEDHVQSNPRSGLRINAFPGALPLQNRAAVDYDPSLTMSAEEARRASLLHSEELRRQGLRGLNLGASSPGSGMFATLPPPKLLRDPGASKSRGGEEGGSLVKRRSDDSVSHFSGFPKGRHHLPVREDGSGSSWSWNNGCSGHLREGPLNGGSITHIESTTVSLG